ncbi:hypothetical protein LIER_01513 [Lithospermum erythrorhizon]|uniref:Uncharacterized protein n=1 Tax=Lithospermum erythrorhizon TaxID=34254 RepID=A0AAV3NM69_LITER
MFSKIGSYIGVPLFADGVTSDVARVSYARLYVEVAADKELPKEPKLVASVSVQQQKVEVLEEKDSVVKSITSQIAPVKENNIPMNNHFVALYDKKEDEREENFHLNTTKKTVLNMNKLLPKTFGSVKIKVM